MKGSIAVIMILLILMPSVTQAADITNKATEYSPEVRTTPPIEEKVEKKGTKGWLWIILGVLVIAAVAGGGGGGGGGGGNGNSGPGSVVVSY